MYMLNLISLRQKLLSPDKSDIILIIQKNNEKIDEKIDKKINEEIYKRIDEKIDEIFSTSYLLSFFNYINNFLQPILSFINYIFHIAILFPYQLHQQFSLTIPFSLTISILPLYQLHQQFSSINFFSPINYINNSLPPVSSPSQIILLTTYVLSFPNHISNQSSFLTNYIFNTLILFPY